MKKKNLFKFSIILLSAFVFVGCSGLNKMQKRAGELDFKVTPEVLEMHGDEVKFNMTSSFPEKYFGKKTEVTITPVLKYGTNSKELKPLRLQGEAVEANNIVVNYETGGKVNYNETFDFSNDMRMSDLYLRIQASYKSKSITLPDIKVAEGIISTPTLLQADAKPIAGKDKFQRIIPETKSADIHYLIQQAGLRNSELRDDDIKELKNYIKESVEKDNYKFTGVEVKSYASPDGPLDLNEKVSGNRDKSASRFISRELKRKKVEEAKEDGFIKNTTISEDWDGFQKILKSSNIQDKDLILRVLKMYNDSERREQEIKNMSKTYLELADDVLPKLRRSQLFVNIDVIGLSDEELKEKAVRIPDTLNNEELLYAAFLFEDADDRFKIFESATKVFPNDWRGFNNMGACYVMRNDIAKAKEYFTKAKNIKDNGIVNNNLGVIELINGNFKESEVFFNAALGAGDQVNYNLGIVNIKKGEYSTAVSKFGSNSSANLALAKILNKDYDGALKTLNSIKEKDAMVNYLKAIVGARQGNKDLAITNIEDALKLDPTLASKIKTDMEFKDIMNDSRFKSAVK